MSDPTSACPRGAGASRRAVPAEAANYELGRAFVFHLHHHPFARHVGKVRRLGDHPVEAGTLEAREPVAGQRTGPRVAGVRWTSDGWAGLANYALREGAGVHGTVLVAGRDRRVPAGRRQ